jgi:hypothetical protein
VVLTPVALLSAPPGEPFGLDPAIIGKIDWALALTRISHDLRSDFIYAPHLTFIYSKAGDKLIADLKTELKSGNFNPSVPLTIEVPKSFRIRVAVPSKRLGPNYSRPGSILLPRDRLLYQALADQASPIVNAKSDSNRSFSHLLAPPGSAGMFLPSRTCWSELSRGCPSGPSLLPAPSTRHYGRRGGTLRPGDPLGRLTLPAPSPANRET